MRTRREYAALPDLELSSELDAQIRAMTECADRDVLFLTASLSERTPARKVRLAHARGEE